MADKVRKLKDAASRHLAKGRSEKALSAFLEVVRLEPQDLPSRQKCGDLYRKLGKTDKAIQAYQGVAGAYAADGLLLKAIAICKVILLIDPNHTETQHTLAKLYAKKRGHSTQAEMPAVMAVAVAAAGDASVIRGTPATRVGQRPAAGVGQPLAKVELVKKQAPGLMAEIGLLDQAKPQKQEMPDIGLGEMSNLPPSHGIELDLGDSGDSGLELDLDGGSTEVLPPTQVAIGQIELTDQEQAEQVAEVDAIDEIEIVEEIEIDIEEVQPGEVLNVIEGVEILEEAEVEALPAEPLQVDLETLPPIPLFSDLSKNAFIQLLECLELHLLGDGDSVVEQGDKGDSFFVIASGAVRVVRQVSSGKQLDLARLGEGSFFGEMALLGAGVRSATVIADGPAELFEISQGMLDQVAKEYPSVKQVMMRFYKQRLLANLLHTSPIFEPFDKKTRKGLIEKFKSREIKRYTKILNEGQKGDGLYLLLSGRCEVSRKVKGRRVVLAELYEGDVFGEMSLLTQEPVAATVMANRKSIVLRLPSRSFREVIMAYPQILETVSDLSDARSRTNEELLGPVTSDEEIRI